MGWGRGRGQRLHHHQLGRAALAMAPGRDLGGAAPQGTQDERLPELRLDPRDARVGYAPLHMPVADEIPLGILQGGEETSAVAHGDGVGRRRDRHRCPGPGLPPGVESADESAVAPRFGISRLLGPTWSLHAAAAIAAAATPQARMCLIVPPVRSERRRKWIPTGRRLTSQRDASYCLHATHIADTLPL